MTQFLGLSRWRGEGAGHFSPLRIPLPLGNPLAPGVRRAPVSGALESSGGWRGAASARRAGLGAKPAPARPVGQLCWARSAHPARAVTSRVLPGWGPGAPGPLSWRGPGHGQGWGACSAPPPGKQALPHILHAPRPFPAPSQPWRVPHATPLPAPAAGGACTSAGSGGQAEATLSLRPSRQRPPCH